MARVKREKAIIGWLELADLPDWGVQGVKAKVDTGARTSALDVSNLEELPGERVRFDVVVDRDDHAASVSVEAAIVRRRHVRSSLGHGHERIVVSTTLRVGTLTKTIELGLVSRPKMRCRMLLGRRALGSDVLVNARRCYLLSGRRRVSASGAGRLRRGRVEKLGAPLESPGDAPSAGAAS